MKSKQLCLYQDGDRLMLAPVGLKFYPYTEEGKRKRLYCGRAEMTATSNFVKLEEWVFRLNTQLQLSFTEEGKCWVLKWALFLLVNAK